MSRIWAGLALVWLTAWPGMAQEFSGLARIDAGQSRIADDNGAGVRIELALSQGVPYRLFTLDAPPRLVLDFQEVDWSGLSAARLVASERVGAVQFGQFAEVV